LDRAPNAAVVPDTTLRKAITESFWLFAQAKRAGVEAVWADRDDIMPPISGSLTPTVHATFNTKQISLAAVHVFRRGRRRQYVFASRPGPPWGTIVMAKAALRLDAEVCRTT
jgi:hypothetical protein